MRPIHVPSACFVLALTSFASAQSPNLVAESMVPSRRDARIGQIVQLTSTIRNSSRTTAPASRSGYFVSRNSIISSIDKLVSSHSVPALRYNRTYTNTTNWKVPVSIPDGDFYIAIWADYLRRVKEAKETDNIRSFKMRGYGRLDLVVSHVGAPSSLAVGEAFVLPQLEIRNLGGLGMDKTCPIKIYLSDDRNFNVGDTLVGSATVPVLRGGAQARIRVECSTPDTVKLGKQYLIAYVNPDLVLAREWQYNNKVSVTVDVYRRGSVTYFGNSSDACKGSHGKTPSHDIVPISGGPQIGKAVTLRQVNGLPRSTVLFAIGGSNARYDVLPLPFALKPVGAPGCWLRVSLDAFVPARSTAGGLATRSVPIPDATQLIGARFYTQALSVDPAANALGLTMSRGAIVRLGGRVQ